MWISFIDLGKNTHILNSSIIKRISFSKDLVLTVLGKEALSERYVISKDEFNKIIFQLKQEN